VKSIKEDILSWSKDFLELPNKHLNNYSVCPFAKKTRLDNKIRIVEDHNKKTLLDTVIAECNNFNKLNNKICVIASNNFSVKSKELSDYVDTLNYLYVPTNVYLMNSHPEDNEEEINFLQDTEWDCDNHFFMILIQSYKELEDASLKLQQTKYYNNWPKNYYDSTVNKRKQYRKLYENSISNVVGH
tara:strand:- start:25429 stop:25986 length:558 start_codon:yes stop_codon:yes gene_type:complete